LPFFADNEKLSRESWTQQNMNQSTVSAEKRDDTLIVWQAFPIADKQWFEQLSTRHPHNFATSPHVVRFDHGLNRGSKLVSSFLVRNL
jgi:hypothetical protein